MRFVKLRMAPLHQTFNVLLVHPDLCDAIGNLYAPLEKTQLVPSFHCQLELLLQKGLRLLKLHALPSHHHVIHVRHQSQSL